MKKLISLLMATSISTSVAAESLESMVSDYLTDYGSVKQEYLISRDLIINNQSGPFYQETYFLDGNFLVARYVPYLPQRIDENNQGMHLDNLADVYIYKGNIYTDFDCDGINGNEQLYMERTDL